MRPDFQRLMQNATALVRTGKLRDATAAIQAALRKPTAGTASAEEPLRPALNDIVLDVEAREVPSPQPREAPAPSAPPAGEGTFVSGRYADGRTAREYKLYVPPQAGDQPLPLIVMLHGCTQDPDDFAAGTRMNDAARAAGCFVLYPAQSAQANPHRCWNWFKHSHQQRGRGEPALLAGMTRQVMTQHRIDAARVYVAGLSAGGAMAAILGDAYPDLYAAVGVHSGLASGAAKDLPSALAAMRNGAAAATSTSTSTPPNMPTIVFHGDADTTVHPDNGRHVLSASAGATGGAPQVDRQRAASGRSYTRSVHRASDGAVLAEHWVVHGSGHAWSGGSSKGTYTDPAGPDASAQMLRFFLEHPRR
ncbi:MAG: PHB depolymerase family esterase [Pseudomonadota bacterium]